MVKANVGEHRIEIWFTPSYNVKCTDKALAHSLRQLSYKTYDPIAGARRIVRIDKSELDAFLLLQHLKFNSNLKIEFTEIPEIFNEEFPEGAVN